MDDDESVRHAGDGADDVKGEGALREVADRPAWLGAQLLLASSNSSLDKRLEMMSNYVPQRAQNVQIVLTIGRIKSY